MTDRFGLCPVCRVELRIRDDGLVPAHSPGKGCVQHQNLVRLECVGTDQPPKAIRVASVAGPRAPVPVYRVRALHA